MNITIWKTALNTASELRQFDRSDQTGVKDTVREIIADVRSRGDIAIKAYTERFDGVSLSDLTLGNWQEPQPISGKMRSAIDRAYGNIWRFHEAQKPTPITLSNDGITLDREFLPFERVGIYVPNGTAPLISTVLMLGIPAKIAGCKEIIMCTPPSKDGLVHPAIVYAAQLCGVTQVFTCGGAQAIAAMAYGTQSIPKVTKVFGPGNVYVTEAKLQVSMDPQGCARDIPAGPSEVLVIADDNASPEFVAADLLAQAEHDTESKAILLTTDLALAKRVMDEVNRQSTQLSRQSILKQSIQSIRLIVAEDLETCFNISNTYAPEHLIVQVSDPNRYRPIIKNAGSVFIGRWTTESLGDYASGTNHVLPTNGYASSLSGLGVEAFMKSITYQEINEAGLLKIADCVEYLATLEGLDGHKNAVAVRRKVIERGLS